MRLTFGPSTCCGDYAGAGGVVGSVVVAIAVAVAAVAAALAVLAVVAIALLSVVLYTCSWAKHQFT